MIATKSSETADTEDVLRQLLSRQRGEPMNERERQLLLTIRQAHLMTIGAIEDYLGMDRSVTPKHKK